MVQSCNAKQSSVYAVHVPVKYVLEVAGHVRFVEFALAPEQLSLFQVSSKHAAGKVEKYRSGSWRQSIRQSVGRYVTKSVSR